MNRRGFTLLAVLWLIAALATVAGAALVLARTGAAAAQNRIYLTRGAWAREACGEILLARFSADSATRTLDTVELGRNAWCHAELADPAARLNLNLTDAAVLRYVLANDTLADALLDWRDPDDIARPAGAERAWYAERGWHLPRNGPLADVCELSLVRGFDSARVARFASLFTTRGTGPINPNLTPAALLTTLPGMTPEAVNAVLARRRVGRPIRSADELASLLSSAARDALMSRYADFVQATSFAPMQLVARVEGGIRGSPLVGRATLTTVPIAGRLAVIRREVE